MENIRDVQSSILTFKHFFSLPIPSDGWGNSFKMNFKKIELESQLCFFFLSFCAETVPQHVLDISGISVHNNVCMLNSIPLQIFYFNP